MNADVWPSLYTNYNTVQNNIEEGPQQEMREISHNSKHQTMLLTDYFKTLYTHFILKDTCGGKSGMLMVENEKINNKASNNT